MGPLLVPPTPSTNYLSTSLLTTALINAWLISLRRECLLQIGLVGNPTVPLHGQATKEHCSIRLPCRNYLAISTQGSTSHCTSGLWYNKMTRVPPPSWYVLWDVLDMNNFYFPFSFIFWLYRNFIFFFFSFEQWRGTWQGSHMAGHMMWCHRPRTWWKDLEDDIRAHGVYMVALSKK